MQSRGRWSTAMFLAALAGGCSSASSDATDGDGGGHDVAPRVDSAHADTGKQAHAEAGGDAKAHHDGDAHEAGTKDSTAGDVGHGDAGKGDTGTATGDATSADTGTDAHADASSGMDAATDAGSTASALHVEGNKLVDHGKTVRLLGVDHSGTEYSCIQGNGIFDSSPNPPDQAFVSDMLAWHVNTVRVPLNEDCWLAINGAPGEYSGSAYQTAIAAYVALLRSNGLYVIVDLHWNGGGTDQASGQQQMADSDHAPAFWTGVASTFKGDQGVIFDLYNEPHDISWACWLNGGCQTSGWNVAGMNQLLTAVRGTGASNVVMAGGLAYASDLSEWLANEPTDPTGNLVASFHGYNFGGCANETCWAAQLAPVAAAVPIVTGELGEDDCAATYIDGYMSWADTAGVSYLGWAWNADFACTSGPGLISDWTGTPTGFGAGLKTHLAVVNP